ncbi:hypothetical protein SAMN05421858_3361 [Haladaptatus litoreus]|uniref:Uncharacterized protein n=1 Tax=Haladaptatus litoreus TaxID=553468 RepID=A0A1N7CZ87_9EURY|nr:hypothetical protein SAMN05421858_3361 [Haladaptatus litoreus]
MCISIADFGCLLEADTVHMILIYLLIATSVSQLLHEWDSPKESGLSMIALR